MDKQELIKVVEKARTQTRAQAAKVVDMLCGATPHPSVKKERANINPPRSLSPESEKELMGNADES